MQFMQFTAARADTGQVLPYAKVTVYLTGTATKAALFNFSGGAIGNPAIADATGLIGVAAADGNYDAVVTSADGFYNSPSILKLQIYDLAALAAGAGSLQIYDLSPAAGLFTSISTQGISPTLDLVQTTGYSVAGVGEAFYAYDPAVSATTVTANPSTQFMSSNGRGFKLTCDVVFLSMFGAVAGAAADTAIAAADAWCVANARPLNIGIACSITSSVTIASDIIASGGVLTIANGVTATFSGRIDPSLNQIFAPVGTGKVILNALKNLAAYPEWWGAVPNNGAADCLAPILAARDAHGNVDLQAADYYLSAMLVHDKQFTRIGGKGCLYNGAAGQGTRLLVAGGGATCVQVGPTTQPASINSFPQGIVFEGIHCARTVAPAKGTTAAAVRVQYTLNARLDRVRGAESIYGIHVTGNINLNMLDCYATRASAGTGGAADQYRGIYIDGSASIGAAGGNASIWLRRVNASCSVSIADSACIYIDAKYTDCFVSDPETTSGSYGINLVGLGAVTTNTANRDLTIIHPVCDQHTISSIRIAAVNRSGSVEITNPYIGPAPGSTSGIFIDTCLGGVTINGGQLDMSAATGIPAITITNSFGAIVANTTIHDCSTNAVAASGSANLQLRPHTENYNVTSTGAAVQLTGCTRVIAAPMVRGGASAVATGVQLVGSANAKVDVNVTSIDSTTTALLATVNGVTITARGDYTSAGATLASGTVNVVGQF